MVVRVTIEGRKSFDLPRKVGKKRVFAESLNIINPENPNSSKVSVIGTDDFWRKIDGCGPGRLQFWSPTGSGDGAYAKESRAVEEGEKVSLLTIDNKKVTVVGLPVRR